VTPEQLLHHLSSMLELFQNQLRKFTDVTHIRVCGNVYMCASGLFTVDLDQSVQDALSFAFQCIDDVLDLNMKVNTDIELRIGIATGGPICAGFVNSDKLAFEVVGQPVRIAARCQSQAQPRSIVMCANTYRFLRAPQCNEVEKQTLTIGGRRSIEAYSLQYSIGE
jgi:class 3 adenylate cyclase